MKVNKSLFSVLTVKTLFKKIYYIKQKNSLGK
jgi:hypothetical protein